MQTAKMQIIETYAPCYCRLKKKNCNFIHAGPYFYEVFIFSFNEIIQRHTEKSICVQTRAKIEQSITFLVQITEKK